jgi:GT2 family glycosyltransferase
MRPLVYIIVLNWNGLQDTVECLDSLGALDYPNYRVAVVDNGSTDGSVEHLRRSHPGVELITSDRNRGYAKGNNLGLDHALGSKADYLLALNNDTLVHPSFLSELVATAELDPSIGIVGPKIFYRGEGNRIWFAGGRIHYWLGNTSHIGNRQKDSSKFSGQLDVDYVTGCAMLIRKSVLEEIGTFDPSYDSYYEDCDLCLRAKRRGYRIVCARQAMIWHKVSASTGGGNTPRKLYLKMVNGARFFRRYAPLALRYSLVPVLSLLYYSSIACGKLLSGDPSFMPELARGVSDIIKGDR